MCHVDNEKRLKKNNRSDQTSKSGKLGEKENYKYLEILEADTIKQEKIIKT